MSSLPMSPPIVLKGIEQVQASQVGSD